MDPLKTLLDQMGKLPDVWVPFVLALAVVAIFIWRMMEWRYGGMIERLRDERDSLLRRSPDIATEVELLKQRRLSKKEDRAQPKPSPALSPPPPPIPSPSSPAKKVFIGKPAESLLGLLEDKTYAQAKKLAEPFKGKWIRVTGTIEDVYPITDFEHVHARLEGSRVNLSLAFAEDELPNVEALTSGETITIVGQIKDLSRQEIQLVLCEFADAAS